MEFNKLHVLLKVGGGNCMELYVVNFEYLDGEEVIKDYVLIASDSNEKIKRQMDLTFEELNKYGYQPKSYTFRKFNKTDNGYPINLG